MKALPGTGPYGASKAAVVQLAKIAALEAASWGVRVNAIAPGGVETPIWEQVPMFRDLQATEGSREAAFAAMAKMATPLGRYAPGGRDRRTDRIPAIRHGPRPSPAP